MDGDGIELGRELERLNHRLGEAESHLLDAELARADIEGLRAEVVELRGRIEAPPWQSKRA